MPRTITPAVITELAKNSFRMATLVFIDFDTPVYLTDFAHDLTDGGDTYTASGHLLSVGDPMETGALRVGTTTVTLSAVEQTYIAIFLTQDWVNRQVTIKKALIDSGGGVIADPITVFDGLITKFSMSETRDGAGISVSAASHWADFEKANGRKTNNNSQQYVFLGDLGMEFSANSVKNIKWGQADPVDHDGLVSRVVDAIRLNNQTRERS